MRAMLTTVELFRMELSLRYRFQFLSLDFKSFLLVKILLIILYYAFFYSIINYGITSWGGGTWKHRNAFPRPNILLFTKHWLVRDYFIILLLNISWLNDLVGCGCNFKTSEKLPSSRMSALSILQLVTIFRRLNFVRKHRRHHHEVCFPVLAEKHELYSYCRKVDENRFKLSSIFCEIYIVFHVARLFQV